VQNNNNAKSGFISAKKRCRMISNFLRKWLNNFASIKGRGMVPRFLKKKQDAPLPHPTLLQALNMKPTV
jgi:hypothetical protein